MCLDLVRTWLVRKGLYSGRPGKRYGGHQHRRKQVLNFPLVWRADVPLRVVPQYTNCSELADRALSQVGQDRVAHESQIDRQSS